MTQTMPNSISIADLFPVDTIGETGEGAAVDMHQNLGYENALVLVDVGSITGAPTSVVVTVEESDVANFGSGVTTISSQVVAAETVYSLQVARTKRYLRAKATITGGTTPTVELSIKGILNNWAIPFNIV